MTPADEVPAGAPPELAADLHLHTFFSDGTYSPEELAAEAARFGLAWVSLTDHDTVEGAARMEAACRLHGVGFIAGTELTAEAGGQELHILAYGVDTGHARFLAEMGRFQAVRQNRIREMIDRLNGLGVALEAEAVFRLANCKSPGRPHIARALFEAGICRSVDEAFDRFLKKDKPAWVPKLKMSAVDAIGLVHEAGGIAVFAHPGLNRMDGVIPELVAAGLDGVECFHSRHSAGTAAGYLELAARHGLLVTGGSDCHGMTKGKPLIGSVKLQQPHLDRFLERVRGCVGGPARAAA